MRSYQQFNWPKTPEVNRESRRQGDIMAKRGVTVLPSPPRNLRVKSGTGYITVAWDAPVQLQGVASWRIYLDTESNLVETIGDIARTSAQISLSDHATHNVYVSSVNPMGKESRKILVQGAAS